MILYNLSIEWFPLKTTFFAYYFLKHLKSEKSLLLQIDQIN